MERGYGEDLLTHLPKDVLQFDLRTLQDMFQLVQQNISQFLHIYLRDITDAFSSVLMKD